MHRHLLCLLCALVLAACGGEKTGDGVVFLTHTGSSSDSALADPDGGAGETAGTGDTGSRSAPDGGRASALDAGGGAADGFGTFDGAVPADAVGDVVAADAPVASPDSAAPAADSGGGPDDAAPATDSGGGPDDATPATDSGGGPDDATPATDSGGAPDDAAPTTDSGGAPDDAAPATDSSGGAVDGGAGCPPGGPCPCVPASCDDGDICTQDVCTADKGCLHLPSPVACDDANACTTDSCAAGQCGHAPAADGTACGVGSICMGGACQAGAGTSAAPALSCAGLHVSHPNLSDGLYWIDADGGGPTAKAQTFCDMQRDGGGWSLVAVSSDDGQDIWTWKNRTYWSTDTKTFGSTAKLHKDFKSPLYHALSMKDVLFVHAPSGVWAAYHGVGDGKQTLGQKIAAVGGPHCFGENDGWNLSSGTLKKGKNLCSDKLFFNVKDHDGKSTCDDNEDSYGPVWSANTNDGCPFDDPGEISSLGPISKDEQDEQTAVGFGWALDLNTGGEGKGVNNMRVFVR